MAEPLSNSARRVQEAIAARGMTLSVRELPATTRTATEAAAALGCGVPPVGHREPMQVLIDEDLLRYDEIWTARRHAARGLSSPPL